MKLEKVEEFDPQRCQGTFKQGQCQFRAAPGSKFCLIHGGNKAAEIERKRNIYNFRLARWQTRYAELSDSNSIKSLRDEIALVRFLLQKRLNVCESNDDLWTQGSVIVRLVQQINSLADSCARVENSLAEILDQQDAVQLVERLIKAIDSEITDELYADLLDLLSRLHKQQSGSRPSNYKIAKWESEISDQITSDRIVSLRDEIGVLRMLIEEKLNSCRTDADLLRYSLPICDFIGNIEKLVKSCHRLEKSMGLLLDQDDAAQFSQELITVVGNYFDSEQLTKIAERFQHGS